MMNYQNQIHQNLMIVTKVFNLENLWEWMALRFDYFCAFLHYLIVQGNYFLKKKKTGQVACNITGCQYIVWYV